MQPASFLRSFVAPACLIAVMAASAAPRASACNIPVFRYALERWRIEGPEDLYDAIVFTRGEMTAQQKTALEKLQAANYENAFGGDDFETPRTNLNVQEIDVTEPLPKSLVKLWETQRTEAGDTLPWLVLRYPDSGDAWPPVWSGPLTTENVALIVDSPARREIAKRLMSGVSVVWLLLESGDAAADVAAATDLEEQLKTLPDELKLPDGIGEDGVQLLSTLPVKINFSLLQLKRDAPGEKLFVASLLACDKAIEEATGPIVFPIFGRGRVLDGIHGKDLKPEVLADAAAFLCGECSCLVKRLNPGFDLLTTATWDSVNNAGIEDDRDDLPMKNAQPQLVELPKREKDEAAIEVAANESKTTLPQTATPANSDDIHSSAHQFTQISTVTVPRRPWRWYAIGGAAVLVFITGFLAFTSKTN